MPTGYTAKIKNGISFEEYALGCARAFGATIMMRDDPQDKEIPEKFEQSNHYVEKLAEVTKAYADLHEMTKEELSLAADQEYRAAEFRRIEHLGEIEKLNQLYNEMLNRVKNWQTPTQDHEEFHKFMRTQIEESIKFDCDSRYYMTSTKRVTGKQYYDNEIIRIKRDIAYYKEEHNKELERTSSRNKWIKSLRDSL